MPKCAFLWGDSFNVYLSINSIQNIVLETDMSVNQTAEVPGPAGAYTLEDDMDHRFILQKILCFKNAQESRG